MSPQRHLTTLHSKQVPSVYPTIQLETTQHVISNMLHFSLTQLITLRHNTFDGDYVHAYTFLINQINTRDIPSTIFFSFTQALHTHPTNTICSSLLFFTQQLPFTRTEIYSLSASPYSSL